MPNEIKIADHLNNLEAMAYRMLDEVAAARKELSVENITQCKKAEERKAKTETILLRRRKHLMKKIKAA